MLIDCDTCLARDIACHDCVVTVIFHEGMLDLNSEEAEAISHLSDAGLIPRLRLVEAGEKDRVLPWKDSATG